MYAYVFAAKDAKHAIRMAFDPWEPWVGINDIDGTTDPAFFRVRNYRLQQVVGIFCRKVST